MPRWEYKCTNCGEIKTIDSEPLKKLYDGGEAKHYCEWRDPDGNRKVHGFFKRVWSVFDFRIANKDTP